MGKDDQRSASDSDRGGELRFRRRGSGRREDTEVPVGFEIVMYKAADDPAFKRRLLADREAAIEESGVQLRPSEWATLRSVPPAALAAMIERLTPENPRRRAFMGKVAAAVTSLAAGTAAATTLVACERNLEGGTAPMPTATGQGGSGGGGGGEGAQGAGAAGATGGTGGTAGTGGTGGAAGGAGGAGGAVGGAPSGSGGGGGG